MVELPAHISLSLFSFFLSLSPPLSPSLPPSPPPPQISVHVSGSSGLLNFQVGYPQTSFTIGLRDGKYSLNVLAVNKYGFSNDFPSNRIELQIDSSSVNPGGHPDDVQVLEYPWVYVLVPGLVGVVIIIVISLVICKKIQEKKKRSVSYCRGEGADW